MENNITTLIKHSEHLLPANLIAKTPARFKQLKHMIGNTPLLAIRCAFQGEERVIYAKAEHLNMTGSIKDRMAFHILKRAYQENHIKPGDTIAEATSGNTGISFAAIGRALGHRVSIFMPDWMSEERVALIKSLGAKIVRVRRDQGGFLGSIRLTEEMAEHDRNVFLPAQFANAANVEAHEMTTGPEIWWQLHHHSLRPDAFIAGVGTGGTIMGVGQALRAADGQVRLVAVEPEGSAVLTGGRPGPHPIQGIGAGFIPELLDRALLSEVRTIGAREARRLQVALAREEGLLVGLSSGANVKIALDVAAELGPGHTVVTVLADNGERYVSEA